MKENCGGNPRYRTSMNDNQRLQQFGHSKNEVFTWKNKHLKLVAMKH